jgi:hypothetical protein
LVGAKLQQALNTPQIAPMQDLALLNLNSVKKTVCLVSTEDVRRE